MGKDYKVCRILSKHRIVINGGANDGITQSTRFRIFAVDQDDIIDPDSGENLGKLELYRGTAKPIYIQDRIATLEAYKRITTNNILAAALMNSSNPNEEIAEFSGVQINDIARIENKS